MEKTYKILKVVLLVLALVVLILGASRLYDSLGSMQMSQLATQAIEPSQENQPEQENQQEQETQPRKTFEAPDFTVYDLEGNAHKLSDFRGKPVVLNFWASWCGPCQSEMPAFEEKYQAYGEDIHFLMVNMASNFGDSRANAAGVLESGGYTFPVYYDDLGECAVGYGINAIPVTVFIDSNGNVVSMKTGAMNEADLLRRIQTIIG